MLNLQSVTKLYGTVIGVNDITMSLASGAYGLLGPNGSGKTTLINLLTGQLRPTLGRVEVFGSDPFNNADVFRRIGICPAIETLYANVPAHEWVAYLLELQGYDRRSAAARASAALDLVGMSEAMHRTMGTFSRGMRQRTKLAQAIAHDPELLILDEPFSGLDPIGRHELTQVLRGWIAEGRGVLIASHVLHEVEAITDSFMLISGGRLLASGSSPEIQSLLADVPCEIRIRCDPAGLLAQKLLAEQLADGIRFESSGEVVVVSTRSPARIYESLPDWQHQLECRVLELESSNDSLDVLFSSLLRIHRGEM